MDLADDEHDPRSGTQQHLWNSQEAPAPVSSGRAPNTAGNAGHLDDNGFAAELFGTAHSPARFQFIDADEATR